MNLTALCAHVCPGSIVTQRMLRMLARWPCFVIVEALALQQAFNAEGNHLDCCILLLDRDRCVILRILSVWQLARGCESSPCLLHIVFLETNCFLSRRPSEKLVKHNVGSLNDMFGSNPLILAARGKLHQRSPVIYYIYIYSHWLPSPTETRKPKPGQRLASKPPSSRFFIIIIVMISYVRNRLVKKKLK